MHTEDLLWCRYERVISCLGNLRSNNFLLFTPLTSDGCVCVCSGGEITVSNTTASGGRNPLRTIIIKLHLHEPLTTFSWLWGLRLGIADMGITEHSDAFVMGAESLHRRIIIKKSSKWKEINSPLLRPAWWIWHSSAPSQLMHLVLYYTWDVFLLSFFFMAS